LERPMLSICFDDFPSSAALVGAPLLERHGAQGSFYAAAGLEGEAGPCGAHFSWDDARTLVANGHEIGCHTHSHIDCARVANVDVLAECALNSSAFAAHGIAAPRTLAYPYGETQLAQKYALTSRFVAARGVLPGLNVGRVDMMQLRACPLY